MGEPPLRKQASVHLEPNPPAIASESETTPLRSWLRWQVFTAISAEHAQTTHDQIVTDMILHALVHLDQFHATESHVPARTLPYR